MNWYDRVSKDISNIPDAVAYYEAELIQAKQDVRVAGNIEKASAQMPGIVENRFNQLQEIEGILEYLNIELRRLRSQHFRKYLENYNKVLSSRDADKFADGEPDVIDMEHLVNEFALVRNKWLGLMKGLEAKSFSINNIVKLRAAGMEDIALD